MRHSTRSREPVLSMSRPCSSGSGGIRPPWTSAGLFSSRATSSGRNRGRAAVPGEHVARRWPTSCTDIGNWAIWSPTSIPWLEDAGHTRSSISTSSAFGDRPGPRDGLPAFPRPELRPSASCWPRSGAPIAARSASSTVSDKAQREWLQERIERSGDRCLLSDDDRRRILSCSWPPRPSSNSSTRSSWARSGFLWRGPRRRSRCSTSW